MRIKTCNMFLEPADAIVITTNGFTKNNGEAVMGRGVALQAARSWYGIQKLLGKKLRSKGNRVRLLTKSNEKLPYLVLPRSTGSPLLVALPWHIVAFPVKHNWRDKADLELIATSCRQLKNVIDEKGWNRVLLPRPGCGNGGLSWKKEVRKVVRQYFGESKQIVVVTTPERTHSRND